MKRLVLTVALVALLVAAVFGGQALASSKSNDISISEETSSILGSSYWGYPLRMKTLSGTAEIVDTSKAILDETYSGVRHVSLSLFSWGLDNPAEAVLVGTYVPELGALTWVGSMVTDGFAAYEFDTDRWELQAWDSGNNTLNVHYWATITYPSNQW